jgi:hypothetical protein
MESQEIIDAFRRQLDVLDGQGSTQVQVKALRNYLDALEKDSSLSKEQRKLQHEGMLAHYAAKNSFNLEMLRAVLEAGKSALQALLVINGGAVVALLGVMSNLIGKPGTGELARYLALPLLQFGIGVLCGAVGFALRYFGQACYAGDAEKNPTLAVWGDRLRWAAIVVGLCGYVLFGIGVANAYRGVLWSFSP